MVTPSFVDKYNSIVGTVIAVMSFIFGEYWILFASFLVLNVIDVITGWMKSRILGTTSSNKGYIGVIKKVGYWLIILIAFMMCDIFIVVGQTLDLDLSITSFVGWFVLATFLINELRSILENFVEAGFNVPHILIKGLAVAQKVIDTKNIVDGDEKSNVKVIDNK